MKKIASLLHEPGPSVIPHFDRDTTVVPQRHSYIFYTFFFVSHHRYSHIPLVTIVIIPNPSPLQQSSGTD